MVVLKAKFSYFICNNETQGFCDEFNKECLCQELSPCLKNCTKYKFGPLPPLNNTTCTVICKTATIASAIYHGHGHHA